MPELANPTPTRTNQPDAVRAEGLTWQHKGKRIVDNVHLSVPAGLVTGFLGANGAGKTTTLRLMLGLTTGQGSTTYFGRPLTQWRDPSRIVGVVMGGVAGHPRHTITAHLRMVAAGAGVPDSRVPEVVEQVGLTSTADKRLEALSLGMAQRAGIAQALLGDPAVLFLDEPANGLDPHSIRWLRDTLRQLAEDGKAVLVSSHLLAEMQQLADQVVVLARGRVVAETTIEELARLGSEVTLQSPRASELAGHVRRLKGTFELLDDGRVKIRGVNRFQVGDLAAAHGIPVHWLDEQAPSLEDYYLTVAQEEFRIS
ncbi:ABC transporter ATP-binding protein [Streptomyces anulatus]|uniref:ABC transporter ATP-binding protein n=1 Tax=Streptomyces anulatus TaxID=1892 RepID=UPI002251E1E5|nr:ABC transporter ATP-binding protein [Streptomyces anulatus]MCX4523631.1 ABC transporter ATP-binding protein [Streptomyces anulatus]MCX4523760.1 ABC transporter ATP-binding protein [Streptomyces anulatus]MCX4606730.1 ABC transporter ATP-binding protein [Streptomyces anulatus]MCX4606949.1 ABC transporter ATP-binding protein [Streptomyces anulatus]